jgi:hypothetical protein
MRTLVLVAALLAGCGTQQFWREQTVDQNWKLQGFEVVHVSNPNAWCTDYGAIACANRDYMTRRGTIYMGSTGGCPEGYVLRHEMKHLGDGPQGKAYDHPNAAFTYCIPPQDESNYERDL